jgi:hypothetical protein
MNEASQKSMHQLSGSNGILWALRGIFSSGRDVTLTPESGIFESEKTTPLAKHRTQNNAPQAQQTASPVKRRRAEWITPNKTYRVGGQLTDVYVQTIGVRLAVHA